MNFESKFDPYDAVSIPLYQTATFKQVSSNKCFIITLNLVLPDPKESLSSSLNCGNCLVISWTFSQETSAGEEWLQSIKISNCLALNRWSNIASGWGSGAGIGGSSRLWLTLLHGMVWVWKCGKLSVILIRLVCLTYRPENHFVLILQKAQRFLRQAFDFSLKLTKTSDMVEDVARLCLQYWTLMVGVIDHIDPSFCFELLEGCL